MISGDVAIVGCLLITHTVATVSIESSSIEEQERNKRRMRDKRLSKFFRIFLFNLQQNDVGMMK